MTWQRYLVTVQKQNGLQKSRDREEFSSGGFYQSANMYQNSSKIFTMFKVNEN